MASGSGDLYNPENLRFGPDSNLYVLSNTVIKRYDGLTGSYLGDITSVHGARDLAFGPDGNLYFSEEGRGDVVKVNPNTGTLLQTYSSSTNSLAPWGISFRDSGNLVVSNELGGLTEFDVVTGVASAFASGVTQPTGLTRGPDGRYYISEFFPRLVVPSDSIKVVGANGGTAVTFAAPGTLQGPLDSVFVGNELFVTDFSQTVQVFNSTTGVLDNEFFDAGARGITARPQAGIVPEPNGAMLLMIGVIAILARFTRPAFRSRQ